MIDYLETIRTESARFLERIIRLPMTEPVPSCPGWSISDLAWHLTEVQHFWASIVDGGLSDPGEVPDLERPADADLPALFAEKSALLVTALERREPETPCWTWHDDGNDVGWVRRRQAHEVLIHRVDAELAGGEPSPIDPALATDGVDEVLRVMLDAADLPEWATYESDGATAVIEVDAGPVSWAVELGRMRGTSPNTGNVYDDPVVRLRSGVDTPTAVLRGPAAALDLWLWGRGPLDAVTVSGDGAVVERIRQAAVAGTQ
jgi:uncharacterized protein (TIGR03083 family)